MKLHHDWDKLSKQAMQKDLLWLQNPWLTANVISEITLDYFQADVSAASASGFMQSAIQLWNMLKQMRYLPPPLHDSRHDSNTTKEHVLLFGFLKHWEPMTGIRRVRSGKRQFKKHKPPRQRYHESGWGMLPNMSELVLIHRDHYFPKDNNFPHAQKRGSISEYLRSLSSSSIRSLGDRSPSRRRPHHHRRRDRSSTSTS